MRKSILLVAFAMALAACGGSAEPATEVAGPAGTVTSAGGGNDAAAPNAPDSEAGDAASGEANTSTDPDVSTEGSTPTAAAAPSFDGPPAPDFELTLSDGSAFNLRDEQKPVYMVFWAEW